MESKKIGVTCRNFRRSINKTLNDVAVDTGYTISNVSAFERGKNNNATIYNWYVERGVSAFIPLNER